MAEIEPIQEIHNAINEFNRQHGQTLEHVILPHEEFDTYGIVLSQHYPHLYFVDGGNDIDGRILVQRDPN